MNYRSGFTPLAFIALALIFLSGDGGIANQKKFNDARKVAAILTTLKLLIPVTRVIFLWKVFPSLLCDLQYVYCYCCDIFVTKLRNRSHLKWENVFENNTSHNSYRNTISKRNLYFKHSQFNLSMEHLKTIVLYYTSILTKLFKKQIYYIVKYDICWFKVHTGNK